MKKEIKIYQKNNLVKERNENGKINITLKRNVIGYKIYIGLLKQ